MSNRVMQVGLMSFFATAIAGAGVASAQDEVPVEDTTATAPDADGDGMPDATDGEPADATNDGMATEADAAVAAHARPANGVVRAGGIMVNAALGIGLSKESSGDPLSLAPDVWYGVNDKLAVGLTHSLTALNGFWSGAMVGIGGPSLCLSGDFCGDAYAMGGLQASYGLSQSADMSLAAIGGLIYDVSDPFRVGLRAGVSGNWRSGKIAVMFAPSIYIGLNERDFNKEQLFIPVAVAYAVSPQLYVGVQTGIRGQLDGFGDNYSIPLAPGAHFMVNKNVAVGGAFTLERIAGFEGPGAADLRSLLLFANWSN